MKKFITRFYLLVATFILSGITLYACDYCEDNNIIYLSSQDYIDTHVNDSISKVAAYYLDYMPEATKIKLKNEVGEFHAVEHSVFLRSGIASNMSNEELLKAYSDMVPESIHEINHEEEESEYIDDSEIHDYSPQPQIGEIVELEFEASKQSYAPYFDPSADRDGLASYLLDYKYDDSDYIDYFIGTICGEFKGIGTIFKMIVDDSTTVVGATNLNNTAILMVHFNSITQEPLRMELSLDPSEYNNATEYKSTLAFNDCYFQDDRSYNYTDCVTQRDMNMYMDDNQVLVLTFFRY